MSITAGMRKLDKSEVSTEIRTRALGLCKNFKTSWVGLGQALYAIYQDKLYYGWGYDEFEEYTKKELGFKHQVAMKMVKSYLFLEQEEPSYLHEDYAEKRDGQPVPSLEEINVLRLAKSRKDVEDFDFKQLKRAVFEKGKEASVVKKELTAIIKERKQVDPEEERKKRSDQSLKDLIHSLRSFEKDAEALKLIPFKIIEDAKDLLERLNKIVDK